VPLRWIVIYAIAAGAFTLIYKFAASRAPPRWRWVAFGGLTAALVWMAGSLSFSWYLNTFTHLGVTYGSLGAMIGFMLWVWFSVTVVLAGAEFNAEIEHQTAWDTTTGAPRPLGARGAVMADTVGPAFTISPREAVDLWIAFLGRQKDHVVTFFRRLARA
jgi:membrane protein